MSLLKAFLMEQQKIMYATIKGSLTENDGVFSGFSSSNYLKLSKSFVLNSNTQAEFLFKINIDNYNNTIGIMGTPNSYGVNFVVNLSGFLQLFIGNGSTWSIVNWYQGTTPLSTHTNYWIKLIIDKGNISVLLSTDGKTYNTEINQSATIGAEYTYDLAIGLCRQSHQYLRGSIDLNNSYIKLGATKYKLQAVIGYTVVGSPTITDGVVSGFSASDGIQITNTFPMKNSNWEIVLKATTTGNNAQQRLFISNGCYIRTMGADPSWSVYMGSSNYKNGLGLVSAYPYIKIIKKTSNSCDIYLSSDGINYTYINNCDTEQLNDSPDNIVFGANSQYWNGAIDLNETYIKINNKLWFNGQQA